MKYAVKYEKRAGLNTIRLVYEEDGSFVEIIPSLGGTVHQIAFSDGTGIRTLLMADSNEELFSSGLFRGRLLFPWNDRIPGGKYVFRGTEYRLPINDPETGSSIHGFLYRNEMRLLGALQDASHASIRLGYRIRESETEGYPFPLYLEVEYTLSCNRFDIRFKVHNSGSEKAPVAFGWHPYFMFGSGPENAVLTSDFTGFFETDSSALPVGPLVPISHGCGFDVSKPGPARNLNLDHAFSCAPGGEIFMVMNDMRILLTQDSGVFRYTQLFTPPAHDSIAVEPVTAAPDSFNHPERGLIELDAGAAVSGSVSIRLCV